MRYRLAMSISVPPMQLRQVNQSKMPMDLQNERRNAIVAGQWRHITQQRSSGTP
jgi:hypothetical protein